MADDRPDGDERTTDDLPDECGVPLSALGDSHDVPTGSDSDGDSVEYSYAWEVNNIPIIGESDPVLDRAFFSMGGSVACIVTPFDGESTGASLRSREVNVIRPSSTVEPDDTNCRFGRRCK